MTQPFTMRYNTIAGAVLTAASAVVGKELPKDETLAAGMCPPIPRPSPVPRATR